MFGIIFFVLSYSRPSNFLYFHIRASVSLLTLKFLKFRVYSKGLTALRGLWGHVIFPVGGMGGAIKYKKASPKSSYFCLTSNHILRGLTALRGLRGHVKFPVQPREPIRCNLSGPRNMLKHRQNRRCHMGAPIVWLRPCRRPGKMTWPRRPRRAVRPLKYDFLVKLWWDIYDGIW